MKVQNFISIIYSVVSCGSKFDFQQNVHTLLSRRLVSHLQYRNFILQLTSRRIQRNIYILWA